MAKGRPASAAARLLPLLSALVAAATITPGRPSFSFAKAFSIATPGVTSSWQEQRLGGQIVQGITRSRVPACMRVGATLAAVLATAGAAGKSRRRRNGSAGVALEPLRATPEASEAVENMLKSRGDLMALTDDPRPRGGKRVGSAVWFDVTLSSPLGLALDNSKSAVGVTSVLDEGSAAAHNAANMVDGAENFIQQGDRLLMVNGQSCTTKEEVVSIITKCADKENIRLKFSRDRNGFVNVCFPETDFVMSVRPQVMVRMVAEVAGVGYTCREGSCNGSCWHRDLQSREIYQICRDTLVGEVPSKMAEVEAGVREEWDAKFDNVNPLVLEPCPEVYREWRERRRAGAA